MKLAIVTSGGANFYSIEVALQRLGINCSKAERITEIAINLPPETKTVTEPKIGIIKSCFADMEYQLANDKSVIEKADGVIFPGVGSAAYAMQELARYDLIDTLRNYKKPLLGICLGMQLLYEFSTEGNVECLGILPGKVEKFRAVDGLVVPHVGWNNLIKLQNSSLLSSIDLAQDVYFVHSYYAPENEVAVARCEYGVKFAAIAQKENFYAMQFHPEKSGLIGQQLLKNFIEVVNGNLSSN